MTHQFEVQLNFAIPEGRWDVDALSDAVFEAGFQDAVPGVGRVGVLAVMLEVEGDDAESAIVDAARALIEKLPEGSKLHEVQPDRVSIIEVADMLEIPRESLQLGDMPLPVSGNMYRLEDVEGVIGEAVKPKAVPGNPNFDEGRMKSWFLAGRAARTINAKMTLGLMDPVTLRDMGSIVPVTEISKTGAEPLGEDASPVSGRSPEVVA